MSDRVKRSPGEVHPDPRDERLRALYARAYVSLEPSETLRGRVTEECLRVEAEKGAQAPRSIRLRPRREMFRRFGWAVALIAVGSLLSIAVRGPESAVEAAIRASASAPAMHTVMKTSRERTEFWIVYGVGLRFEGKRSGSELIEVDDMRRRYRYEPLKARVEITPSLLKTGVMNRGLASGAGMLEEMVGWFGPDGIQVETIVRAGRRLKLLSGPNRVTRVTIDPETDRILLIETGPTAAGAEVTRHHFDYPDPATVDRRLFRLEIPEGVTVVDRTRSP